MHQRNMPDGYYPQTETESAPSCAMNGKLDFFILPVLSLVYLFNDLRSRNVGIDTSMFIVLGSHLS